MLPLSLPPAADVRTKVSVLVVTYNHEKYIGQALDSVLMQKTNFDYEVVIIEDYSTDRTRDIVLGYRDRYPNKIRLILAEKNKCTNEDLAKTFQAAPSPYIAWLDGDDYWTSPHKLQKQVDFLDAYPEYSLCFHNVRVFYEDGSRRPWNHNPADQRDLTLEDLWGSNPIAGCSPMFRKDKVGEIPDWYCTDIWGDWPLYILGAQRGKIGYIDEVMGAYRIHEQGAWSGLSEARKLEAFIEFYRVMNANLRFRYDQAISTMISKCYVQLAAERSGMPYGVPVIVVSEGENPLPYWEHRPVWCFPQNEWDVYVGRRPSDSAEAIAHLEELHARGGGYLIIPEKSFWWLSFYKGLHQHLDKWHQRVWEDSYCVIYELSDMPVFEVTSVSLAGQDSERLWGHHIDLPKANTTTEASAVDLVGWVLGKRSPAVAVEVLSEGSVVKRLPLNHRRPDIAEAFPDLPGAEESGFKTTISVLGTTAEFELRLQAVLKDQSRVALGVIRGIRRWEVSKEDREVGMALVSVVIPCYNQARFLGEAIESVLKQTYPHFEVIVIDDGSTDNTSEVASRYPGVRCIRQENQGLAGARNTGIRRSNGSYLVFLDSDDRLLPDALAVGLRHLKERPECAFVSGHWELIASDGSALSTPPQPLVEKNHYGTLLRSCYISSPAAVMYQRIIVEHLGGFDTSVSPSADYDLYLRIARQYPVYHHGEVVAEYRRHGSNMTRDPARMLKSEVTVLRRQRRYLRKLKQHKAYKTGVRHSQEYFGDPLVDQTRACIQEGKLRQTLSGQLKLLRYYPAGFTSVLRDLLLKST